MFQLGVELMMRKTKMMMMGGKAMARKVKSRK